jgi:hypothetical protein
MIQSSIRAQRGVYGETCPYFHGHVAPAVRLVPRYALPYHRAVTRVAHAFWQVGARRNLGSGLLDLPAAGLFWVLGLVFGATFRSMLGRVE